MKAVVFCFYAESYVGKYIALQEALDNFSKWREEHPLHNLIGLQWQNYFQPRQSGRPCRDVYKSVVEAVFEEQNDHLATDSCDASKRLPA